MRHPSETLGRGCTFRHSTIRITTHYPTQFIDLTDEVEAVVAEAGVRTGFVNVQSLHTTTAIIVNEHEPLLLKDVTTLLERIAPEHAVYSHDNLSLRTVNCVLGERPNGHSHCRALFLSASVCLNVDDGRLQLGRWQRLFLAELDGPRTRDVSMMLVGDGER
jgi:secondary thiamine-phosphate synthase enzyme